MPQAIQAYYGEFLINPVPLEMSLIEPCDYGCSYCFAVLGDRHQAAKSGKSVHANGTKAAMRLIADFQNRKTLEARLLQEGYPVLLSNRTDPLGRANRTATLPMLEVMAEMEIPVAIQTKGFAKPDDLETVLEILQPSVWYISIAFWDDDARKRVEPGAPSIGDRLALISTLREAGHEVIVGFNPCVPEFLPDPEPLLKELKARGVWGVWLERLHLNHWQEKQLTDREKASLGQDLITRAKKQATPAADFDHLMKARAIAQDVGLEIYTMGQNNRSDFWQPYRRLYPKTFPTIQDYINACYDLEINDGDLLSFETLTAMCSDLLPSGVLQVGHYIGSTAHQICREMGSAWSNQMTYEQLLRMCWSDPRIKMGVANNLPFSYAYVTEDESEALLVDEQDVPLMVWNSEGHENLYVEVA